MSTGESMRIDGGSDVATPRRDGLSASKKRMALGRAHAASVDVRRSRTGSPVAAIIIVGLVSACAPALRQNSPVPPDAPQRKNDAPDQATASTPSTTATADSAPSATHPTVRPGPSFGQLPGWMTDEHQAALDAFRRSCTVTTSRTDTSALTQPSDWREACAAAVIAGSAREFFEQHFSPVVVEDGTGLHTGYYEPEIAASRTKSAGFRHAIYKRPSDVIVVAGNSGGPIRYCARWDGKTCIPYFSRGEIEDGVLARRRLEIAYAADPYELFFMHMQGSGRLRMQDGSLIRIAFDGHNGREWVSIARTVKNELNGREWPLDTDGILAWLRAHPKRARALMREDESFVFFRELREPTSGPLGAIHVPLTAGRSLAADPKYVPLGAPVWVTTRTPSVAKGAPPTATERLLVAQDTGGAIRGPNRFDIFFGSGDKARAMAGKMFHRGYAIVLLPIPAFTRIFGSNTTTERR